MFSLILAAAVAAAASPAPAASPSPAAPMPDVANARLSSTPVLPASKWAQPPDRQRVIDALRRPISEQMTGAKGPYYCFLDDISKKGETRRVCRKRADWNRLGLEPVL